MIAELWAYIADLDSFEWHVSFCVSDWDKETLDAVIISIDDTSGEDCCMIGPLTHTAWPVFCACDGWRVNNPLVSLHIESGSSLEPSNIRTVSKFSLSVATQLFHGSYVLTPAFELFVTSKFFNSSLEHTIV